MSVTGKAFIAGYFVLTAITNVTRAAEPVPELGLFLLPGPSLRTNVPPLLEPLSTNTAASAFSASTGSSTETSLELSIQRFEAMNGESFLKVPEFHSEPGGAYGFLKSTVFDPITTPEVVRIKKVQLTGGIVGAIKKKNPFYLLNPLVFAMDW